LAYLKAEAANGKVVLFVGTKRQAREVIKQAALAAGMPYLTERWIGGLLTNFEECKRRLKKYRGLKQQIESGEVEKYTKKEQSTLKKQLEKMDKYLSGLVSLEKLPDILYIADLRIEKTAVTEARRIGLPVVAVKDKTLQELIKDGENGYLTSRDNKEFAKKILLLLKNDEQRKEMGKNAQTSTEKYSLVETTKQLVNIYTDFLNTHKKKKASPFRKTVSGAKRILKLLSEPI
jgi:glycosyltransferase involved in cell wall biosynthesis